ALLLRAVSPPACPVAAERARECSLLLPAVLAAEVGPDLPAWCGTCRRTRGTTAERLSASVLADRRRAQSAREIPAASHCRTVPRASLLPGTPDRRWPSRRADVSPRSRPHCR